MINIPVRDQILHPIRYSVSCYLLDLIIDEDEAVVWKLYSENGKLVS